MITLALLGYAALRGGFIGALILTFFMIRGAIALAFLIVVALGALLFLLLGMSIYLLQVAKGRFA